MMTTRQENTPEKTTQGAQGLPIRPGHPLYPMVAAIALIGLIFGPAGHEADAEPDEKTHPYFPDHFWPYPVLAMGVLITLGLLAVVGQALLQLSQAADPRAVVVPRPEWYFLALFQFVKLGPALLTSILIPGALVVGLIFWPVIDAKLGPRIAHRLGWHYWPAPKGNLLTGTMWIAGLAIIGLLMLWAAVFPDLCLPWFVNGPVCGG
jgi:quinol-cytochrome oxidoreductase complex cytochrome b subunit